MGPRIVQEQEDFASNLLLPVVRLNKLFILNSCMSLRDLTVFSF